MTAPVPDDLLWELALGALPDDARRTLEGEMARSDVLRARFRDIARVAASLAGPPLVRPVTPRPAIKEQLLRGITGPDRFAPLWKKMADFVDLPVEAVRAVLARLESPEGWTPSVLPGLLQTDFVPGAKFAGCETGLVRLPAGFHFQKHTHEGHERVMVLQGRFRVVGSERVMQPGDVEEMPAGSTHAFDVEGDGECILVATLTGPLTFH